MSKTCSRLSKRPPSPPDLGAPSQRTRVSLLLLLLLLLLFPSFTASPRSRPDSQQTSHSPSARVPAPWLMAAGFSFAAAAAAATSAATDAAAEAQSPRKASSDALRPPSAAPTPASASPASAKAAQLSIQLNVVAHDIAPRVIFLVFSNGRRKEEEEGEEEVHVSRD